MPYVLGVDVGTTHTAAAVCRLGDGRRDAEIALAVPSLLQLTDAGTFSVGDVDPGGWTAQGFSRRVGDTVPFALGPETCSAEELTALMVMWVAGEVASQMGETARQVAVVHPVGWGPYRRGLLHQALRQVGVDQVLLLPEPVAAAENHAKKDRVPVGATLGVYAMGSHAFSCALVRRTPARTFEVLAATEGTDHHAGADFDDTLAAFVRGKLGKDAEVSHHECHRAKAALSTNTQVTVHGIAVTQADFAEEVRPAVDLSVQTALHTFGSTQPDAVLLVGGATRMPSITDALAAALDCRILSEAAPETSVVKGAALAARLLVEGPDAEPEPIQTSVMVRDGDAALRFPVGEVAAHDQEITAPPPRPPVDITPLDLPERRSAKKVVRKLKPAGTRRTNHDDEDSR